MFKFINKARLWKQNQDIRTMVHSAVDLHYMNYAKYHFSSPEKFKEVIKKICKEHNITDIELY